MSSKYPHTPSPHVAALGIFFSDLDGTLLRSDNTLSAPDRTALQDLARHGIVRVIATGRSLRSFCDVIEPDFPADYVIFSTGAGVARLDGCEIIKKSTLNREEIMRTVSILRQASMDFMLHQPIPHNHLFAFEANGSTNPDFETRVNLHKQWACPLKQLETWSEATQFVAILPPWRDTSVIDDIRRELARLSVIRATSPFDHQSTWMEIFPGRVSKGSAASWLGSRLGLPQEASMAIGNDYNDLAILQHAAHSYVVANAPEELTRRFATVASNNDNGVAQAVSMWLQKSSLSIDATP
jgi:Cof subfamily protein (haloacid dehalogenase superfamily)